MRLVGSFLLLLDDCAIELLAVARLWGGGAGIGPNVVSALLVLVRVAPPVFRGDPAISTTILVQSGIPDGVPFSNQGGYANAEVDALIAKAAGTLDENARVGLYHDYQKLVAADLPLINVAEWGFTTVKRSSVKNVSNNPRWAVSNWADVWLDA